MDELHRARPTPQLQRVMRQLDSLQIALAMGIFARDQLAGVLLLATAIRPNLRRRRAKRASGAVRPARRRHRERGTFHRSTEREDYNETLLENLTSGVIAAGTDERITVFNNEPG